jgi:hypothetical protein
LIFRFDAIEQLGDLKTNDAIFRINNNPSASPGTNLPTTTFPPCWLLAAGIPCASAYYIHIMPDGGSLIAGGVHMPTSSDLQAIHSTIVSDSGKIRKVIDARLFGNILAASPAKNSRQRRVGMIKTILKSN